MAKRTEGDLIATGGLILGGVFDFLGDVEKGKHPLEAARDAIKKTRLRGELVAEAEKKIRIRAKREKRIKARQEEKKE